MESVVNDGVPDSRAGSQFGHYRMTRLLGAGGFGEVYEAEDTVMNRQVALKLIATQYCHDPVFRERLFREARTAGRLNEPHIVPIHGCGEIDGQLYIDMRLISGTDLATVLAQTGPLDPERAVDIVRQIAAALDAAHTADMIHRDIKPSNILLTDDDFACLVDFGLANAATDTKLTSTGTTIGTFGYMAPERLTYNADVNSASDVYALACVLYECLTGSAPYAGGDVPMLISAHLNAPIPHPSRHHPAVPAAFDDVITNGMAKDPAERYRSAGDLARAAQQALTVTRQDRTASKIAALAATQAAPMTTPPLSTGPPPIAPVSPAEPSPPARRRDHRIGIAVTVAAVSVAIAAVAGIFGFVNRNAPTTSPATRDSCEQAQQVAESYALVLTSVDYRSVDDNFAQVLDGSTGEFKDTYTKASAQLRQSLIDNQAVAHGEVLASAVQSCTDSKAVVLLFVDQTVTNTASPEPKIDRSRLKMTLEKVDNRWLASEVDLP